jgi:hypothetical protein
MPHDDIVMPIPGGRYPEVQGEMFDKPLPKRTSCAWCDKPLTDGNIRITTDEEHVCKDDQSCMTGHVTERSMRGT